jgi:hypothetical protein
LSAAINTNGEVVDLEVLDGPIELVLSAVNAARKWKYRPYLLMGNPVEVRTEIMVNLFCLGNRPLSLAWALFSTKKAIHPSSLARFNRA